MKGVARLAEVIRLMEERNRPGSFFNDGRGNGTGDVGIYGERLRQCKFARVAVGTDAALLKTLRSDGAPTAPIEAKRLACALWLLM